MKKIILTGGGAAGYVTPNLTLIPSLQELDCEIHYIGSYQGIKRKLIERADIPYDGISSGKPYRYFDIKNFSDPLRTVKGYGEAPRLMKKYKSDVVFSEGGFVAVPVVPAAKHYRIPTTIHGSDTTPGLANKLCIPSAKKVCCNLPEILKYLPEGRATLTGSPIRVELLQGDHLSGLQYVHLSADKPVVLVIGGSLGSVTANSAVHSLLSRLLPDHRVVHICGKGNPDESLIGIEGYVQYEYVDVSLRHLFAASNIVISRTGANSVCEILALRKPNILIPLSVAASRDGQILNAESFRKQGFSTVIREEQLSDDALCQAIREAYENRVAYIHNMEWSSLTNVVKAVIELIESYTDQG